tara:strand:- start:146 stop:280 length:135 start_codon:yes stop_codon:yes gene_type:complete
MARYEMIIQDTAQKQNPVVPQYSIVVVGVGVASKMYMYSQIKKL